MGRDGGGGMGAPDIRGQGGYRTWKRNGWEVGEIEGNFCNRLIFCKSKGVGTRNARYGRYGERVD